MMKSTLVGMQDFDVLLKILLIGNSGVGKSSLLLRFADNTYSESYMSTIGVDFRIKTIEVDDKIVKLQVWDTAGQERFRAIATSYYRGAHGIMVAYDVTDRESFQQLPVHFSEIERYCRGDVAITLLGNKCDAIDKRQVTVEEGVELAKEQGVPITETSAKDATNVEQAFLEMARRCLETAVQPTAGSEDQKRGQQTVQFRTEHVRLSDDRNLCC